jgi:putative intracellular protease/amidase
MNNKKVVLVVAHKGYQPVEYGTPKKLLEVHGHTVITCSDKAGTATATDSSTTKVDLTLDEINVSNYDGIFFIGGSGALEHLDNNRSYEVIQQAVMRPMPLGAICISTRILAKAGALAAKKATGWNGDGKLEEIYRHHGVIYLDDQDIVTDGLLVTAVGPKAATAFAEAIIELI